MRKPVIAITANSFNDPHYDFPGYRRIVLNEDYPRSIAAAGATPILLAPGGDLAVIADQLDLVDAVVLSGGSDVAPLHYGQEPRRGCGMPNPSRDAYELELLRLADERQLPVFGICRGMQILNVFYGGTLHQDLAEVPGSLAHSQAGNPADGAHTVALRGFAAEAMETDTLLVNSFHHQVLDQVAPGFEVAATAPDGIVEAIERPGERLVAAVQWHPEMTSREGRESQALFRWLVGKVAPTR